MKVPCGFCSYTCLPADLFFHVMTDHGNMIAHLQEELAFATAPNMGPKCNVVVGGERCGKDALVFPELVIPVFDKKTMLSNPTIVNRLRSKVALPLCGDHALQMTAADVLKIGVLRDVIEEQLGSNGFAADWLRVELVWNPYFVPPLAS